MKSKWNVKSGILLNVCLLLSAVVPTSCVNTEPFQDPSVQLNKEVTAIDNFLNLSGAQVIKDISGVRMVIEEMGEGLPARTSSVIDIDYVGMLFDPSIITGEGFTFDQGNIDETDITTQGKLNKLIQGWQIALTRLPVGTKAKIYIPSQWAYGSQTIKDPQGNVLIPANSTLVFDIEFNEVIWTTTEINRFKTDTTAIESYLESKSITNYETDSLGVRYVITQQGSGMDVTLYDQVKFNYKYYLLSNDQAVISEGTQEPGPQSQSKLVDYIQGIVIGISKLNEGGKIKVYVPSIYCFGPEGLRNSTSVNIPSNAVLIIEIEFVSIMVN